MEQDQKERVLHQNMLFPLCFNMESVLSQHDLDMDNSDVVTEEVPWDINESTSESLEGQPIYQGPVTHSHTKALMKANLLMDSHFEVDKTFIPHIDNSVSSSDWFFIHILDLFHSWIPSFT